MFVSGMTILHADLDAFFASVEQRDDARLRGRPVIVGGGVVLAASYEAKAFGVRTAMGGRRARQLCPHAIVVPPRMSAYSEASKAVFALFEDTTPLVEGLSIDEAFLDVRGLERLAGPPDAIAARLRRRVLDEVGLPITVGIARTKFLAKVASAVAKPDGLLVVPPDDELGFLHPLPVERLWGVGPGDGDASSTTGGSGRSAMSPRSTRPCSCTCSGELRAGTSTRSRTTATRDLSGPGGDAAPSARSELSVVGAGRSRRLTRQSSPSSTASPADCELAEGVCRTVVLRLRFDDFSRATRSLTLPRLTDQSHMILTAARSLLASATPLIQSQGLTLVGISLTNLEDADRIQLTLTEDWRPDALDAALDEVRDRFGSAAVTRAVLVGRDPGISMPLLPD